VPWAYILLHVVLCSHDYMFGCVTFLDIRGLRQTLSGGRAVASYSGDGAFDGRGRHICCGGVENVV
jgi:hypothetical protein